MGSSHRSLAAGVTDGLPSETGAAGLLGRVGKGGAAERA
jgi:hypothetical protein